MDNTFYTGVIWGSLIIGALCGLLPLLVGTARKKKGLAVGGFVASIIMGFIAGIFAALPIAIVFTVIIALTKSEKANE